MSSEHGSSKPRKGAHLAVSFQAGGDAVLEATVFRAQKGDRDALEAVVRSIQGGVYGLALRFLWHPEDAEDATQEILLRVVTRLGSFRAESAFKTWLYRVACNALLTMKKKQAEQEHLTFDEFAEDLTRGLSDAPVTAHPEGEKALLLEEVKIGCTTAMLLCLDRNHRLAYILGEILEFDHNEASRVLGISSANYRKRLSRARAQITGVMQRRCGLFDPANACRCEKRVKTATEQGRLDPEHLLFATSREQARRFPVVLEEIRRLESASRAAALFRSHPAPGPSRDLPVWLRSILARNDLAAP